MNATATLFGTTYNVGSIGNDITLEGPRGGFYLLTPVLGRDNVYTMNSIRSGEKRIHGNRAFVALIGGELVEAGKHGRIELPEVETTEDAELDELNAEYAALVEIETRPTVEATKETLAEMIRDSVRAGQDFDTAYQAAVSAMILMDRDAVVRLAEDIIRNPHS